MEIVDYIIVTSAIPRFGKDREMELIVPLSQTILEHFAKHHPKGGGCRSAGFVRELKMSRWMKASVNRAMVSLHSQGKLTRICRGKYRLATARPQG